MDDFVIDDASVHFAASKNADYRERVARRFRAFADFLQSNELVTRTILGADEAPDETLRIMRSDLTEEGFQVVQKSYDKWLRGLDTGKGIDDVSALEKSLARIRGK